MLRLGMRGDTKVLNVVPILVLFGDRLWGEELRQGGFKIASTSPVSREVESQAHTDGGEHRSGVMEPWRPEAWQSMPAW
ncbi:MAG: hypothetical protein K0S45_3706 [Nitrospira sp.]|nr:hypothetical protein [Nitrospira sp.]